LLRPAVKLAQALGALSRRSRRGGGTSLPGKLLLRLRPRAIAQLGTQLERGSVVVSATNGKTTTARMIASVLGSAGIETVHNRAGANMPSGIATALLAEARGGRIDGSRLGLFEVDEAWLGNVVSDLTPHTVVLGNLFRDQLDRYGELERLADEWAEIVTASAGRTTFVLNADDPLVADLGRDSDGRPRERIVYFGLEDRSQALAELEHAFDAKHCRRCGSMYRYAAAYLGHLGDYACPHCGNRRPAPAIAATRVELHGMSGSKVAFATPAGELEVALPLPGLYNVYNSLAALAAAQRLGLTLRDAARAMESMRAVFGRVETVPVAGKDVSILLIKNPAGANEVLRTLLLEADTNGRPTLDLWVALNDRIADGRDISWVWDADFELLAGHVRRVTCAGTRAPEMAVRLKYAGIASDAIEVDPEISRSIDHAVERADGRLFALPTYTALLELRTMLSRRGLAEEYWA
jgi:lipid II isoglutaminyl synthase (glutamine-hydrolysing)